MVNNKSMRLVISPLSEPPCGQRTSSRLPSGTQEFPLSNLGGDCLTPSNPYELLLLTGQPVPMRALHLEQPHGVDDRASDYKVGATPPQRASSDSSASN